MKNEQANQSGWLSSWLLPRGERVAAPSGIAIGGLLLGVLCAAGGWSTYSHWQGELRRERERAQSVTRTLAESAGVVLAAGDAGGVQKLITDTALLHGFAGATLRLPDGGVIADAEPARVTVQGVPQSWAGASDGAGVKGTEGGLVALTAPVTVEGRGAATLEVSYGPRARIASSVKAQAGFGVIAVLAFAGGWAHYRSLRRSTRALCAVQESLRYAAEFEAGELPMSGLRLSEELGEEARAWNRLLDEREALRRRDQLEQAAERFTGGGGGGGDHAAAFDALWFGLVVLDEQANVRALNGAAGVLLKKQKGELLNKDFLSVVTDKALIEVVRGVASGASRQRASVEVQPDDAAAGADRTILRYTVRPMRREDGVAALVVIEDITQQKVANESREAFVAQATHELRTPLTTMRLYIEQLVEEGDEDPAVKARCINVLNSETRRLERIVGDMLSVAEMEAGTFQLRVDDVRFDNLMRQLEEDFRAQAADKDLTLTFELPPKWPVMHGDRDKIAMALHNLIGNAVKYTPQGGCVTVRAAESGSSMTVDVIDNGIGIKEEERELVFEKFYRSKDARIAAIGGTGIGLALARQVVRMHGGDITLKSELDKGSTFTLSVPTRAQQQRAAA
ncbi:MAG TPA: ATP-binding protein [Phycisphaerales bacterium]|nr:ATP-binding protein [Phycisphaerales bacterium]